jgi:hypothetical protein
MAVISDSVYFFEQLTHQALKPFELQQHQDANAMLDQNPKLPMIHGRLY